MRERLVFAGQVALIAACAVVFGVKIAEAIKLIIGVL